MPIHFGNGFTLAETGGVETVTLTVQPDPAHTHPMLATTAASASASDAQTPCLAHDAQLHAVSSM